MAKCLAVLKVCQTSNERQDYAFDLTEEFERHWVADRPFETGDVVRPSVGTGLQMAAGADGVSNGELEPEWPSEIGETVDDGSITWTAEAYDVSGLVHRIVEVTWTAPAGITASDQVETDHPALQEVRIWVSGGTFGETYTIVGLIETNQGAFFEVRLEVEIK